MKILITVPITDESYWQCHPFGAYDAKKNKFLLKMLRNKSFKYGDLEKATDKFEYKQLNIGYPNKKIDNFEPSFLWKREALLSLIKKDAIRSIFCFGSGDMEEAFVLREIIPKATIKVIDWKIKCDKKSLEELHIEALECDIVNYMKETDEQFDLIFSQHVLEHMYRIDDVFSSSYRMLKEGGKLVSCLPLCLQNHVYASYIIKKLESSNIKLLDLSLLDMGHPWKVDEKSLVDCLRINKYTNITVIKCNQMLVRNKYINESQLEKYTKRRLHLYNVFDLFIKFPISIILEFLMNKDVAGWSAFLKIFYAIETIILFIGGNEIANFVPEVLVVAEKSRT